LIFIFTFSSAQNSDMRLYCFVLFVLHLPTEFATGVCELPASWAGAWFESGVREGVNITANQLSHKGTCVRSRQHSQYIFRDRSEGCYRCLSMHAKHANVLQYKESRCHGDHRQLCHSISVDEPLRTLFRVGSPPEHCPIPGHYSFSYSRGRGDCNYPRSSLSTCGNQSSLVFRYQACPDIKGSESGVEVSHCIASWREGSTDYFAARLENQIAPARGHETNFRCFVYKRNYAGFLLSRSSEGVCNLYTATEGDTTFKIQKLREEESGCEYPAWFREHRRYTSWNHSLELHLNHIGTILSFRSRKPAAENGGLVLRGGGTHEEEEEVDGLLHTTKELECSKAVETRQNSSRIVTLSTKDCESGFECVEVERVSGRALLLRVGRLTHSAEEACHPRLFFNNVKPVLLTSVRLSAQACPFSGQYSVVSGDVAAALPSLPTPSQPNHAKCPSLVSSCANSHTMSFTHACAKQSTDFTCHDSWEIGEGRRQVILSQPTVSAKRFCLIVNKTQDTLSFEVRPECNQEFDQATSTVHFTAAYHGDCSPTALATANRGHTLTWSILYLHLILTLSMLVF